jgi:thioredoxin 1
MQSLDASSFKTVALQSGLPVLVDFWAPWCGPCKVMLPILENLAETRAADLVVAKLNVDEVAEARAEWGVRGIPTMILFRDGKEAARHVGTISGGQLNGWLAAHGVATTAAAAAAPASGAIPAASGAFRGEPALKAALMARLLEAAPQGRLPEQGGLLSDGQGATVCSVLAGEGGATALPYSFGLLLDLAGLSTEAEVREVFDAIPVGADLDGVALRFFEAWLSDQGGDWAGLIGDESIDALRLRWLALAAAQGVGTGDAASRAAWEQLRVDAIGATRQDDPTRMGHNMVTMQISSMSPPPLPDEHQFWDNLVKNFSGYLKHALAAKSLDFARPNIERRAALVAWCREQAGETPERQLTPEWWQTLEAEWRAAHPEAVAAMAQFRREQLARVAPVNAALRKLLAALCAEA